MKHQIQFYDGPTLGDFTRDVFGAISAFAFIWSVIVWAPYLAAH